MRKGYFAAIVALLFSASVVPAQAPTIPPVPTIPPAPALGFVETSPVADNPAPVNARVAHRVWGDTEVLFWWTKNQQLSSPIVTSTPTILLFDAAGNSIAGGIGVPGTSVLVGNSGISTGMRVGTRLTFGVWLDSDDTIGIEGKGVYLSQGNAKLTYTSSPKGAPLIGIPFFNSFAIPGLATGENQVAESTPFTVLPVGPPNGGFFGGNTVITHNSLWGAEANGVLNLLRNDCYKLDVIGGFKYMGMDDDITLIGQSTNLNPLAKGGGGVFFLNKEYDGTVTATDTWSTKNQFYGGQIGMRGQAIYGRFAVDLRGQVAVGQTMQTMKIEGSSTLQTATMFASTNAGGTLALQNNIGTYHKNAFSVLPEGGIKLNYFFTSRISGFVGYDIMYWTNVARAGQQIDRSIDVRQVPTISAPYNPAIVNTLNPPEINNSSFWAQGVTLGLQFKF